ncbi:hypothetical protein VI817_007670 [Penicillium citrinum]|nr:hypothetical protein VI817_007670 [Penicillium citrinum]
MGIPSLDECAKAEKILRSFLYPKKKKSEDEDTELGIPRAILSRAKGLAIFTATKAGLVGSFRFGSGLIVVRLTDGSWSAPSAMSTGGIGFGTQLGFERTDFIFVLNSEKAIETFTKTGSITLGKNLSCALGPYGRSAEFSGVLSSSGLAGMFAYSKARGVFGGKSWEGGIIGERPEANKKMYGTTIPASDLLSGKIEPPSEAKFLMEILNSEKFQPQDDESDVSPMTSAEDLTSPYQQGNNINYSQEMTGSQHQIIAEMSAEPASKKIAELPAGDPSTRPVELPAEVSAERSSQLPVELPADIPCDLSKKVGELSMGEPQRFNELDSGPIKEVFELPDNNVDAAKPREDYHLQPLPLRINKRS